MSQIEIDVLKQGRQSKYVMSCSFFTMKDSYRNFDKYRKALTNILTSQELDPKYELRIYVDDSSKEDALALCNKHDMHSPTILHFNCPDFRDGDGHIGTFGTLVRFLPLFEKDLEEVWISDIDIPDHYLEHKPIQRLMEDSKVFIQTSICYDRKIYARKYTIVANRTIFRVSFSKAVLTRFLTKLKEGRLEDTVQKLNAVNTRKPSSKVPYGIDEVFMNTDIYNLLKKKDIKCCILKHYNAENFLHNMLTQKESDILKNNYYNPSSTTIAQAKKIYKAKLPLIVNKYPCLQDMIDNLDSLKNTFAKIFIVNSSEM